MIFQVVWSVSGRQIGVYETKMLFWSDFALNDRKSIFLMLFARWILGTCRGVAEIYAFILDQAERRTSEDQAATDILDCYLDMLKAP